MEQEKEKLKSGKRKINFKRVFQKNQFLILALALMVGVAGYLNFAGKKEKAEPESVATDISFDELDETDLAYLNGEDTLPVMDLDYTGNEFAFYENNDEISFSDVAANVDLSDDDLGDDYIDEVPGEAVFTSGSNVTCLIDAKLLKEQTRAKNKEILMDIVNNTSLQEKQKQDAIDSIVDMTKRSEKEMSAEILLETKGFQNAVVSITGESADVCVALSNLDEIKSAQIMDIVQRKTGIKADKIVISTVEP